MTAHLDDFRKGKEGETPAAPLPIQMPGADRPLPRYQVNVLVDNGHRKGAPVVVESNPTYHNLTGRIEHQASWGGVATDYTMIKPGALHRANGGYLIVPARECLLNPFAWEGLKPVSRWQFQILISPGVFLRVHWPTYVRRLFC